MFPVNASGDRFFLPQNSRFPDKFSLISNGHKARMDILGNGRKPLQNVRVRLADIGPRSAGDRR
jgi:hypothetical protein